MTQACMSPAEVREGIGGTERILGPKAQTFNCSSIILRHYTKGCII